MVIAFEERGALRTLTNYVRWPVLLTTRRAWLCCAASSKRQRVAFSVGTKVAGYSIDAPNSHGGALPASRRIRRGVFHQQFADHVTRCCGYVRLAM